VGTWHAIGGAGWGTATAAVQGANTDTDAEYAAVKDPSGSAITWTADGSPKSQVEGSMYSRPNLTAVGVGATVVVTCLAVRNQKRTS
jgi:hypothetical protein